jgi:DNA modification methylase
MKISISISKDFKNLIYPLNEEELHALETSILRYGIKMPLVVWKKNGHNYLLDGFHRWKLIKKYSIKNYKIIKMRFSDRGQAKRFIFNLQLGRRNCSIAGISYLRGSVYNHEKLASHRPKNGDNMSALRTSERLSKEYKVTARTIIRDGKFTEAVDKIADNFSTTDKKAKTKTLLLSRGLDLSKKDILDLSNFSSQLIRDVIEGKREFWEARSEQNRIKRAKRLQRAAKLAMPQDIKLYVGDCLELSRKHIGEGEISCIITDPPYSKDSLNCFDKLGQIAKTVLKESGFCCFYTGKMFLADVMKIMSKHLNYYWQIALLHHGSNSTVFNPQAFHARRINEFYKPILIFQKPPSRRQDEYCDDVIRGSGAEKSLHHHQQGEMELHNIVEIFSEIGTTVLDPFNGAGTTGVVCKKLGRKYIGFDIDDNCIKETKIRIKNIVNVETYKRKKNKKPKKVNIKLYHGDCRIIIPKYNLLKKCAISIFDPPYNQNFKYDGYKDNMPRKEYIKMLSMFKSFSCCIIHYPEQSMSLVYEAMQSEPTKVISWNYHSNLCRNYRLISCFNCSPDFTKLPQTYEATYDRRVQKSVLDGRLKPLRDWWNDISPINNVSKERTEHPCQLPVALCERLLSILTTEGQTVLDPFAGVGSLAVACKKLGRHFIGVEIVKNYIEIGKKRLKRGR